MQLRRLIAVVSIVASAAALTLAATAIFASPNNTLAGSPFNGSDGTLDSTTPTPIAFNDLAPGKDDNAFGQGTKEDDTSVNVVTGSIPPNKNDLTEFWINSGLGTTGYTDHTYLYLAWSRAVNTGSANLDFEFNQNKFGLSDLAKKDVPLNRAAGDILVLYDFGGSGTPVIRVSRWITSGTCAVSSDTAPCWGQIETLSQNSADASVSQDGLFGEAVIDLVGADIIGAGQCAALHQAWVKSRSSTSLNAELKDFISPGNISIDTCQPDSINVHKRDTSATPVPLDGAVFQLWKESSTPADTTLDSTDSLIESCTSGSPTSGSGDCTFSNITVAGLYYVKETTAPTGYGLPSQAVQSVTVVIDSTGHTYNVTFNDPPLYRLIVITCTMQNGLVDSLVSLTVNATPVPKDTTTSGDATSLCAIGGATYPDLPAGSYNGTVQIPAPTATPTP